MALHSPLYHLLPVDLRLNPSETLAQLLAQPNSDGSPTLSNSLPTLLLFECVLAYMQPESSNAIIQWFVDYFSHSPNVVLGGLVYEMFGLKDAFGKVMLNNMKVNIQSSCKCGLYSPHFQARNISLPGAEPFPDVPSLTSRFARRGFTTSHAMTLRDIRRSCITQSELERCVHRCRSQNGYPADLRQNIAP